MKALYRDDDLGARLQYEALRELRERQLDHLDVPVRTIYERRVGRTAAGAAGLVGAAWLALASTLTGLGHGHRDGFLLQVLMGTWGVAGIAYLVGRLNAKLRMRSVLQRMFHPSGNPRADVERLLQDEPLRALGRMTDRLERWSVALPMMALSLIMPLTLHAFAWILLWNNRNFDDWILMSLAVVGHAHLVLAYLSWRFARNLHGWTSAELTKRRHREGWLAWVITTAASCFPGILLLGIPPGLVAVTGLFGPIVFYVNAKRVVAERQALTLSP